MTLAAHSHGKTETHKNYFNWLAFVEMNNAIYRDANDGVPSGHGNHNGNDCAEPMRFTRKRVDEGYTNLSHHKSRAKNIARI